MVAELTEIELPVEAPPLPEGWRYGLLGELVEKRGILYGIVQPGSENSEGVPIVRVNNIRDGRIDASDVLRVDPSIEAKFQRSRLQGGEVLLTLVGTLGEVAVVPNNLCGWNVARAVGVIPVRADPGNKWVSICLRSSFVQHCIRMWATTTVQATFNLRDLAKVPIPIPPKETREAIAAVLGALDDKIELNRRMNATLEALARALFQSWFVDFDPVRAKLDGRSPAALDPAIAALFPNEFEDSELGHIPHGWRAAHLEEIARVGSGKRPEGRCDVLSPECNIPLYGGGGRMGYVSSALYEKPILFTGRVGTLGLIFRTAEPSWPSDNTLIVEPQSGFFDFTYFVLRGFDLISLNRGSTQPLLTQTDLKRQPFALPTQDVVQAFANFSEPIFRQMVSNERESRTLATLRDTLLPKLLSGELSLNN